MSDGSDEENPDISDLAELVVEELDPGQRIGDKIILSRRQLIALAGGGLSVGALTTFGVREAEAQAAAGTVGTAANPIKVEAHSITFPTSLAVTRSRRRV
jgi:hypothetical protein